MAIRPPPKSLDGRSARELFVIEKTTDNGGEPEPPLSGVQPIVVPLPFQTGADVDVFLTPGSGEVDPLWPVARYDSRGHNQVRVVTNVETAGGAEAQLFAEYSDDNGSSWDNPGETGIDVVQSIASVGPRPPANQGWVNLSADALGDRLWRMQLRGGDGVASPALWGSHLQFRQRTAPTPPRGGDTIWGNIVGDWDANGVLMLDLEYADGADVNLFPDESGSSHDFGTAATLLLPTYQTTGFNGAHPCVEWAGGNIPLTTANNPTEAYTSYTYYFVLEALDGGDTARLWGHSGGDSFQYSLYFDDTHIKAANNNLFGGVSITVDDDFDMSAAHIYRWVKTSGSASHSLWVDGVLKGSATAAPQTNNGGLIQLMSDMGGIGMSGRVAKIVVYDRAHNSPTGTGAVADGLTGPELALATAWGL